uniref:Uncharacterized protein n=1 Tax=Siphoviridae sp. ctRGj11 TaxID=2827868 RepID=A0A8S5SJT2_9CAUD|nr:MAG TPA: hypothetical protein [Siphoviridae sp. ctRGj11]
MAGPENWKDAPEGGRGGQYVTTPGFAALGQSSPTNSRTAPGSKIVYSPKGWRWEEAGDDYSKTISKLTAATMESAVRRIRTSMGEVSYIRGTPDTQPPFSGQSVGDTCRVQDAQTLDIVAEWRWDGANWERMKVTSEQISNLDVGKLTAGSASIAEVTARKIASDVGRFLEITTDQLTVTGNASFVNATAHHVWTEIITAGQGEFEQIKAGMLAANSVSASNIQGGAIDGQVITGATIQTERNNQRGIKIDSAGIRSYTSNGRGTSFEVDAATGRVKVLGEVGIQDSWSIAQFIDIVETLSGNDVGQRGDRWGVGLSMNSKVFPYKYPALVTFKEDPSVSGGILYLQAPSSYDNGTPNMRLATNGLSVYSGKTSTWQMNLSRTGFGAGAAGKGNFQVNDYNASITVGGYDSHLYIQGDNFRLRSQNSALRSVWGNATNVVLSWDGSHQVVVDRDGFRAVGGKNFIMRVPGEWQKRHMMLQHASTESPHDGIEYWENVELDSTGHATWVLPDYVPKIASPTAPWIVLTSSTASARLIRTGYGADAAPWSVEVSGQSGETVAVLVKGARQVDEWDEKTDTVSLRDRSKEPVWVLPPATAQDGEDNQSVTYDDRGGYGPAPAPTAKPITEHTQEES